MKSQAFFQRLLVALVVILMHAYVRHSGLAAQTNVIRFEAVEGYSTDFDLVGQGPWTGFGSGGNGIVSDFFPGQGQQAYVGFSPPDPADDQLVVWPTNQFNPVAAGLPIVTFSVQMQIVNSANGEYDYFQWRVYNPQGHRLFILDFDNYYTNISYRLDGNSDYTNTGFYFTRGVTYPLLITMNFAANRWSASLGSTLIIPSLPITTTNAPLGYGDADAVWYLYDINAPGDNYMLFDNYRVTAEAISARVELLERTGQGSSLLRVYGPDRTRWSVDATTNFVNWTALKTNTIDGAYFELVDTTAAGLLRRFYRARLVP